MWCSGQLCAHTDFWAESEVGGEGEQDYKIWFSALCPIVRAGLLSRRKAQAASLWSLWLSWLWFPGVTQVKCSWESLSTGFTHVVLGSSAWLPVTETLLRVQVALLALLKENCGATWCNPSKLLQWLDVKIISLLLDCSYLLKCWNSVCKYWTLRISHSNWHYLQLFFFDSSWQKLLVSFPLWEVTFIPGQSQPV